MIQCCCKANRLTKSKEPHPSMLEDALRDIVKGRRMIMVVNKFVGKQANALKLVRKIANLRSRTPRRNSSTPVDENNMVTVEKILQTSTLPGTRFANVFGKKSILKNAKRMKIPSKKNVS